MSDRAHAPEPHFESLEQQAHAARLGMWLFLASELLLFAGLFALFVAYRMHFPAGFREGVRNNTKVLGSINTAVLLVSSTLVALGVHALRARARLRAVGLVALTVGMGAVFLAVKVTEYRVHFAHGIFPGGAGSFFVDHPTPGLPTFWTLYFIMTGLHAVHVTAGMGLLLTVALGVFTGKIAAPSTQRLEIGAIYWHLIDVVWLFLWPLFYLA